MASLGQSADLINLRRRQATSRRYRMYATAKCAPTNQQGCTMMNTVLRATMGCSGAGGESRVLFRWISNTAIQPGASRQVNTSSRSAEASPRFRIPCPRGERNYTRRPRSRCQSWAVEIAGAGRGADCKVSQRITSRCWQGGRQAASHQPHRQDLLIADAAFRNAGGPHINIRTAGGSG
jgi:hypothetical protein